MSTYNKEYQKQWRLKNLDKDRASKRRYYEKTKERYRERERAWRKNNPDRVYENSLKYKYGIDLQSYNDMLKSQNYGCKLCDKQGKLLVDYCHKTNKVRGLLCNSCNKALGLFYDNVQTLERAMKYVKETS